MNKIRDKQYITTPMVQYILLSLNFTELPRSRRIYFHYIWRDMADLEKKKKRIITQFNGIDLFCVLVGGSVISHIGRIIVWFEFSSPPYNRFNSS